MKHRPPEHLTIARPGLAYQYAFDWLAVQLQAAHGPVAALVTAAFHGCELLRRLPNLQFLEPLPPMLGSKALSLDINPVHTVTESTPLTAAAWVEPLRQDSHLLPTLQQQIQPGGRLYLVAGGRLARFLTERQQIGNGYAFWSANEIQVALIQSGWRVQSVFGLHGLTATAWHYLGELYGRLGQIHWRDRCHYAMRRAFVEKDRRPGFTALACLTAERLP
jgi:hypothetical protein